MLRMRIGNACVRLWNFPLFATTSSTRTSLPGRANCSRPSWPDRLPLDRRLCLQSSGEIAFRDRANRPSRRMLANPSMNPPPPGRSRAITLLLLLTITITIIIPLIVVLVWANARPCPQNRKPQHGRKVSAGKILLKLLHPPQKLMMTDL